MAISIRTAPGHFGDDLTTHLVQKPPPKLKLGFDRVIAITIMSATGAGLTIGDVHLHGGFARESADLAATN